MLDNVETCVLVFMFLMAWTERPESREKVYNSVKTLTEKMGIPPTLQEIAADTDLKFGSVVHHVTRLINDGRLRRLDGKARGLVVVKDGES